MRTDGRDAAGDLLTAQLGEALPEAAFDGLQVQSRTIHDRIQPEAQLSVRFGERVISRLIGDP
jgi:hypothetical protein